ncbi:Demethylmenaquinone methyltransferase [Stieleria neptunia]|uniref:Demethylmenaquinone methyltransferase n=1 Tax=Stieleria neptunia TaxID=2527979 RepID=A0A518HVV8_9BACT|nr:Demethylmenaquinone methyltransferase [Stieleria neptunia]
MTANVTEPAPPTVDTPPNETAGELDKSNARVREMFRQIAPRYDLMNQLLSLNIDKYWRSQAVKRLRLVPGVPALDVCTGTGDLAIAIADAAPQGVEVVGSDFCYAMLEIARQKRVVGSPSESIDFLEADSQQLPFASNRFQCVTVAFGLRNVADTDRGLREMDAGVPGRRASDGVGNSPKPTLPGAAANLQLLFQAHFCPGSGNGSPAITSRLTRICPIRSARFPDGQHWPIGWGRPD